MDRAEISQRKTRKFSSFSQENCQLYSNPITHRKKYIESFTVFHPLLDRLLEIKMAKCFQHGQIRTYENQQFGYNSAHKGSLKIFSLRPKTSSPQNPNYKPNTARPKSTNTIIRSRTCQPRVQKKLQMISKQQTEMEEEELKPSLFISKALRRSSADPMHDTKV